MIGARVSSGCGFIPRTGVVTTKKNRGWNFSGFFSAKLVVALLAVSLLPDVTQGLRCYECLSIECESGAICESIKATMVKVFVPKSHFIHFNPNDPCPDEAPSSNSTEWASLSRECYRSDSICLVTPIEVRSVFEGSKSGSRLEPSSVMTSYGYLRGCASRRKLLDSQDTIRVPVELVANEQNISISSAKPAKDSNNDVMQILSGQNGESTYLNNTKFPDKFVISQVYSHEFYIDQGTNNATRCITDNCNTKVRSRRSFGTTLAPIVAYTIVIPFVIIGVITLSTRLLY